MKKRKITNSEIVQSYCPIVKFITEILGPHCEVVLHDYATPDHSVVAIENGHLSGRQIGSPVSDMGMKRLRKNASQVYIANYISTAATGKRFRSASYAIRNFDGELIGSLCVNIDIAYLDKATEFLNFFTHIDPIEENPQEGEAAKVGDRFKPIENLNVSVADAVSLVFDMVTEKIQADPMHMTVGEKQYAIKLLNDEGIFVLKGSVAEVARRLNVSEPTVYRYLKIVREANG